MGAHAFGIGGEAGTEASIGTLSLHLSDRGLARERSSIVRIPEHRPTSYLASAAANRSKLRGIPKCRQDKRPLGDFGRREPETESKLRQRRLGAELHVEQTLRHGAADARLDHVLDARLIGDPYRRAVVGIVHPGENGIHDRVGGLERRHGHSFDPAWR